MTNHCHVQSATPTQDRKATMILAGKSAAFIATASGLALWASPPVALLAGIFFALLIGHPFITRNQLATKWLLQTSVVLLGLEMDLPLVLHLGLHGSLFAAVTITSTLAAGYWLGEKFGLGRNIALLISSGTAICGGSAIAAVSTVIGASHAEIAVSIGTVFLLNAVALLAFPWAGHLLHLSQAQFGLWAGVAIHDISSVVGAGLSYGPDALNTAAAVKLSRTLWIVPLTLALSYGRSRRGSTKSPVGTRPPIAVPWFIALFLLASFLRGYLPVIATWSPEISRASHVGMILVLFLIGTALSPHALRTVGWRTAAVGLILWVLVSVGSLLAIYRLT